MFYLARVVDNRKFGQTGMIEVFLPQKSSENGMERYLQRDLKEYYTELKNYISGFDDISPATKFTYSCLVLSPIGNGYNLGEFAIPQINSIGLVSEIENKEEWSKYRYIWLGGLYGSKMYGTNVILPNDDTVSDTFNKDADKALIAVNSFENSEDTISGSSAITDGQYILKTKTSRVIDFENLTEEMVNLETIPADNTFVLNKNKAALRHNEYDGNNKTGISQIYFDKSKTEIKRYTGKSDDKRTEQVITINDNSITIDFNNKNNSKRVTLSFDQDGNTNLETTGDVKFHSEGNMTFEADKKFEIHSKKEMSITSDSTTKIVAKKQAKFEGNGVDLGQHLENMSMHYIATNTTGTPTNHALAPGSISSGTEDKIQAAKGFKLL